MSRISSSGDHTVHEYINRNVETDNMHPAILRSEIEARPMRPRSFVPNSLPLKNTATPRGYTPSPINGEISNSKYPASKIEVIKNWSVSTYKCTKQLINEKLGKSSKTVDIELETEIEQLRETQKKYGNILKLAKNMAAQFQCFIQTQQSLGEAFAELSQKSPELQQEFIQNSETQKSLSKNGESLLNSLNFFVSSVNTLCNKTIEDTLITIKQYECSRIEYDAYRSDLEMLAQMPRNESNIDRVDDAQQNYQHHKEEFEKLRSDVIVKLKFLDENRVKVMHKQLLMFHNATIAYFSNNHQALESSLKQFNIKPKSPTTPSLAASWLEK
ncbi:arfaptin-2 [Adelges cooleyi]|uniref:arfaptin-2 n=1 Tax=Adelges cooleyi TaxID=133065 RepID=UPI00217FA8E7|nr:arfaptin-2 [Adelges cooleyi]XP_050424903.1 arfaptin-2 [Adelges cooleyi]XP_050424904.1 arfaptin-2 [Adelges cooleyi]